MMSASSPGAVFFLFLGLNLKGRIARDTQG
jgi:hypothetical protein